MCSAKRNLYLVGMPGAGKSTIGKALARELALPFVDADQAMVEQAYYWRTVALAKAFAGWAPRELGL